jgi:hypothetical protein
MEFRIIYVKGHVEVFEGQGRFLFSEDNETEARSEMRQYAAYDRIRV